MYNSLAHEEERLWRILLSVYNSLAREEERLWRILLSVYNSLAREENVCGVFCCQCTIRWLMRKNKGITPDRSNNI